MQVLSDDEKRSLYDRYGEAGLKGAGMGMGVSRSPIVLKENAFRIYYLFVFSHLLSDWDHCFPVPGFQQPI